MADPRIWALLAAVSMAGLGAVYLTVWDAGSAAAKAGDIGTVGDAIVVMVLVIVAAAVVGLVRGEL